MNSEFAGLLLGLAPELSLVLGALLVLGYDLAAGAAQSIEQRMRAAVAIAMVTLLAAGYQCFATGTAGPVFQGALMLDTLALASRCAVLLLALLTIALAPATTRTRHPAEFVAVLLFATAGFTLMAAAQQLLLVFLAIELASLSLYVLAGFDKSRPESAEAALKYFLFGGMSAAFLLFGFSLLYGLTGSIELSRIALALEAGAGGPLLLVAVAMVVVSFGFKAAAAPFHLWAPDVYQGAPVTSAALIASASKIAGVAVFTRLLWHGLTPAAGTFDSPLRAPGWLTLLALLAAAALLVGNIAALAQSNLRRLLAYSAIAHAGVILLGVMIAGTTSPAPVFYYVVTYGLATAGAFGVAGAVEKAGGESQQLADLAGLHRRSPVLAGCLLACVLSLAGIPPFAGFFGKFAIFAAALQVGGIESTLGGVALLAIALSAVALYYYLLILKQAFVAMPADDARPLRVPLRARMVLIFTAAMLLALGLGPSTILRVFS